MPGCSLDHNDCSEDCTKCKDLKALTWFADRFTTCTLKDPSTRHLALSLQQHKHFPQKCQKGRTKCRYGAPWFPCLKTIIQVPPRVKFKEKITNDEDLEEIMRDDKVQLAKEIQCDMKVVLEDEDIVTGVQLHREDEVQKYLEHRGFEQKIEMTLIDRKTIHSDKLVRNNDPEVLQDYNDHIAVKVNKYADMTEDGLLERLTLA